MCGIFGLYDREGRRPEVAALEAMARTLGHRGPNDQGIVLREGAALGNTRLSIIDLDHGHQPFVSDDGGVSVVHNGEVFNYLELARDASLACRTRSDTEVILRLYQAVGPDFARRLNGMFAIAVHDAARKELRLYRDRVGVKPLYYHDDGRILRFASEIKALLAVGVPRRLDEEALHHYLTFNYVPPPMTLFAGVRHVPPGHVLSIGPEGVRCERWWTLADQAVETRPEAEWTAILQQTFSDAVRLRLRADVPFGAFLSGGIDSSAVVGTMASHLDRPVRTFSIGFQDPRFDETAHSDAVAHRFRTEHRSERVHTDLAYLWPRAVYHCDQPHGDASFLPTYRLSELAARQVKVVLTGDGGDEIFAGYDKHREYFDRPPVSEEERFERSYFDHISLLTHEEKTGLYGDAWTRRHGQIDSFEVARPHFEAARSMDRINRALYLDTLLLLPGNNLVKPDRMGMAVSIEARTPFLDYRIVELAFRIPGALKLKGGQTKHLLKRAMENLVGPEIAHRKKQMFTVPVGEWFKGPLAEFVRNALLAPRTRERGIFRPERVETLLDEHRAGRANHTRILRALVALELWFRIFIDEAWTRPPTYPEIGLAEPPPA